MYFNLHEFSVFLSSSYYIACHVVILYIYSAVNSKIKSKTKVFVYINMLCTVYIICIYKYTHMHIYLRQISYLYININYLKYIIQKYKYLQNIYCMSVYLYIYT